MSYEDGIDAKYAAVRKALGEGEDVRPYLLDLMEAAGKMYYQSFPTSEQKRPVQFVSMGFNKEDYTGDEVYLRCPVCGAETDWEGGNTAPPLGIFVEISDGESVIYPCNSCGAQLFHGPTMVMAELPNNEFEKDFLIRLGYFPEYQEDWEEYFGELQNSRDGIINDSPNAQPPTDEWEAKVRAYATTLPKRPED